MSRVVAQQMYTQWREMITWVSHYISELTAEELAQRIAPGRNHGVWILGHLLESEDDLSRYLGRGDFLFPAYESLFEMKSPLKEVTEYPPAALLKEQWKQVVEKNDAILQTIGDEELSEPHALLQGDIEKDFYKTKGRCINLWILHQMYHAGQLAILFANRKR